MAFVAPRRRCRRYAAYSHFIARICKSAYEAFASRLRAATGAMMAIRSMPAQQMRAAARLRRVSSKEVQCICRPPAAAEWRYVRARCEAAASCSAAVRRRVRAAASIWQRRRAARCLRDRAAGASERREKMASDGESAARRERYVTRRRLRAVMACRRHGASGEPQRGARRRQWRQRVVERRSEARRRVRRTGLLRRGSRYALHAVLFDVC